MPAVFTLIGAELDYHTPTKDCRPALALVLPSPGQKKGSFHPVGQIEKVDTTEARQSLESKLANLTPVAQTTRFFFLGSFGS